MARGLIALWLLLALPTPGQADPLRYARFKLDSRYDTVDWGEAKSRVQGAVRVAFALDVLRWFDLVGHISTGEGYASRWSKLHDFNGGEPEEFPLYFRRLFVQRDLGFARVQIGAIPPIKGVASSTGIDADGWIDGARLELRALDATVVEFVGGALRDLDRPNMFNRSRTPNYWEVEITRTWTPWLLSELSLERLSDDHFGRGEVRFDLSSLIGGPLQLGAEGLYGVERTVGMGGVTVGTDALAWVDPSLEKRLRLKVYGTYIHDDIGARGALSDDFIQFGYALQLFASGRITQSGALSWFGRYVHSETPRVTLGLKLGVAR